MTEPLNAPKRGGSSSRRPSAKAKVKSASKAKAKTKPKTKPVAKRSRAASTSKAVGGSRQKQRSESSAPKRIEGSRAHRRIESRRDGVEASRRRKRLLIVAGAAGTVVLAIAVWAALHLSVFRLHHLAISGNIHETQSQIAMTAGLSGSPALIDLSAGGIEQHLVALPWVKAAKVSVVWPATVKVAITERRPAGAMSAPGGWVIVDGTGRVLSRSKTQPVGIPLIQLPVAQAPPAVGGFFTGTSLHGFMVAGTLPPAFKAQVALVVVHGVGTVTLHLVRPVIIEMGQPTELGQKYEDIAAVVAGATLHAGDVLNVSVPQSSTISGP